MGGKASGEMRRRRKAFKESMNLLLELLPTSQKDLAKLRKTGIAQDDMDNSQLVVLALFEKAKSGDIAAIREIFDLTGESPRTQKEENVPEIRVVFTDGEDWSG